MLPLLIVGGILLALAALLLAPVRLELSFREAFSAQVRYLFFRIPLAPGKEEEPPPPQEPPPPGDEPPKGPGLGKKLHAMLRREGLRGFLQTLQELAQAVGKASKSLLKKLRLNRFDLYICLGGEEDAAQGAILYGQVCGLLRLRGAVWAAALPAQGGLRGPGLPQPGAPGGFFRGGVHPGVVFIGRRAYTTV